MLSLGPCTEKKNPNLLNNSLSIIAKISVTTEEILLQ